MYTPPSNYNSLPQYIIALDYYSEKYTNQEMLFRIFVTFSKTFIYNLLT